MLSTIFVILFLLSLLLLIWGVLSPKSFSTSKQKVSRKDMGWTFGVLSLIFFVLVGVTAPEPENTENLNQTPEPQTSEVIPEAEEIKPSAEELAKQKEEQERNYWHEVINVVDGDTVKARVDGKVESIRVIGINAPESTIKRECFGAKSSAKAKEFLEGKWIQLEKDGTQSNRDKYGRLLRYIWFDEGTDFGKRLIEEGYAYEYTYNIPYKNQKSYKETQKYSESKNFGLWSPKTCNGKKQKPAPKPKQSTSSQSTYTAPKPRSAPKPAPASNSGGVVKMSNSGICHAPGTTYYSRTTNFTPYNSVQACLNAGGRLPLR